MQFRRRAAQFWRRAVAASLTLAARPLI